MINRQIKTATVAQVSGVYFPGQRLTFKIKNLKDININDNKSFGIVSRMENNDVSIVKSEFKDHYNYGVLVEIIEEKHMYSSFNNENTSVLLIEAQERFKINRVVHTLREKLLKVCEVECFDDIGDYES